MTPRELKPGDIVQINPACEKVVPALRGHLMIVDEPKSWGAQGYVVPIGEPGRLCYVRVAFEDMEHTGGREVWGRSID